MIGLIKDKLGSKIMTKFVGLKSKMIKRIIKRKLKLEDYKNFLEIK